MERTLWLVSPTGEMSVLTCLERQCFSGRDRALSAFCDVIEIETGLYAHRDTFERRWTRLYREFESPPLRHWLRVSPCCNSVNSFESTGFPTTLPIYLLPKLLFWASS
jgi:hypothetical protein